MKSFLLTAVGAVMMLLSTLFVVTLWILPFIIIWHFIKHW